LIKSATTKAINTGGNKKESLKALTANSVVKKLQMPFENRSETDSIVKIGIKTIAKMGYGVVISTLLMPMPVVIMGAGAVSHLIEK